MDWLPLFAIAIVILLAARRLLAFAATATNAGYRQQKALLTPAERSFYGVLRQAVGDDTVIFAKVRVADVLRPEKGLSRSRWQRAFNRIAAKHLDFVICCPKTLAVKAVLELDDKSHNSAKRAERDRFLNAACASANLTLYRIKAAKSYNNAALRARLFPEDSAPAPLHNGPQFCPRCAAPLVLKTAQRGQYAGNTFLACSAYPRCRYTLSHKSA